MHIQLRRGTQLISGEIPEVGEPFWDDINRRLGLYNSTAPLQIEWYPCIQDDALVLNENQLLGGKLPNGQRNNVVIDYSTQNELIIKNKDSNDIYARFTSTAALLNAASIGTNAQTGINNLIVNGNFSIKRVKEPIYPITTYNETYRSYLVAPNWHLWRGAASNGNLQFQWETSDLPAGFKRAAKIEAINAPNGAGFRSFIYDSEGNILRGKTITASIYIKGEAGEQFGMRCVSSNGAIGANTFTASGDWERVSLTILIPDVASDFYAIDFLYCPSNNNPNTTVWRLTGAMVNFGANTLSYEFRPSSLEQALLKPFMNETLIYVTASGNFAFPFNLVNGSTSDIDYILPSGITIASFGVVNSTNNGAILNVQTPSAASHIFVNAYAIKRTTETQ